MEKNIKKFHPDHRKFIYKKVRLSNEFVELGNLSSTVKTNTKNTLVHEFKPNDITVEHVWLLLRSHFGILGKKRVAIIGSGNIGFKLGLKLVESGASVILNRRDLIRICFFLMQLILSSQIHLANASFILIRLKLAFQLMQ